MRESRTYGSVRGARGNSRPYREACSLCCTCSGPELADIVAKVPNCPASAKRLLQQNRHLATTADQTLCPLLEAKLALAIKNSFGRRRDFRVKMWGTSSPEDKLTGDLGNVIEATSPRGNLHPVDRRSSVGVFLHQEN
jgi:hypothetical protein